MAKPALDEWEPPAPLPPLPDTTGWSTARLEALALERCKASRPPCTLQAKGTVACRRHLIEVTTGKDPMAARDLGAILKALPLPDKAGPAHRQILTLLAGGGRMSLAAIKESTGRSETDASARLRDLRQFGYPVRRGLESGQPIYWLEA